MARHDTSGITEYAGRFWLATPVPGGGWWGPHRDARGGSFSVNSLEEMADVACAYPSRDEARTQLRRLRAGRPFDRIHPNG